MRKGEIVLLALGGGNRDHDRFDDPDRLDLARDDDRHLAFGLGIHRLRFGLHLARLEGEIAISTLLRRMPELRLAVRPEELSWPPKPPVSARARGPAGGVLIPLPG